MEATITTIGDVFKTKAKESISVPTVWVDKYGVEHEDTQYARIRSTVLTYDDTQVKITKAQSISWAEKNFKEYEILNVNGTIKRIGSHVLEVGPVSLKSDQYAFTEKEIDYLFRGATSLRLAYACFSKNKNIRHLPRTIFKYCQNLEDLSFCFEGSSLDEIPEDLFVNCTKLKNLYGCFQGTEISKIPENLFKNCQNIQEMDSCFAYCKYLTHIPADLFAYNNKCPDDMSGCFTYCISLMKIPEGLFDFNRREPQQNYTTFYRCFNACTNLQDVPYGLFKNISADTNFNACFGSTEFAKNQENIKLADYFPEDSLKSLNQLLSSPFDFFPDRLADEYGCAILGHPLRKPS